MSTSFSPFEATLKKAIDDGVLPGAVVAARDKTGKINYIKPFGQASLVPGAEQAMALDTMFPLASMTKLLTCVAVLQLVDRGLITPDADVAPYLPSLAAQPILKSVSPDHVVTVPRRNPILLRHLLTHSSGVAYVFLDPLLGEWAAQSPHSSGKLKPGPSVPERFNVPLTFEPGTGWAYGPGIDWAGHLVEVLSGTDLETYFRDNILRPLGLPAGSITFYPERLGPAVQQARVMPVATRDEATGRVVAMEGPHALASTDPERAAYGGEGATADMRAYMEVLYSVLADDGRLLTSETAGLLFKGALEAEAREGLLEVLRDPWWIVGSFPAEAAERGEYDHSLGGVVTVGDGHETKRRRRSGFLQWGGMFNLSWFIDREAGVTALFATEVAQPADPAIEKLYVALEEAVYAEAGSKSGSAAMSSQL